LMRPFDEPIHLSFDEAIHLSFDER